MIHRITVYVYMSASVTEHESLPNASPKSFPIPQDIAHIEIVDTTIPSKEMHRYPIPYVPVSPEETPVGLELLKSEGGSRSTIDPITKRTLLGAFGSDFNSTRFEVCPKLK